MNSYKKLIKYYDFDTELGRLVIFFSEKGIVNLSLAEDMESIIQHINNKYGQAIKVDRDEHHYHEEIIEYSKGRLKKFSLPLDLQGTEFQKRVWFELLNIPYGETISYRDLAIKIGNPKGYRAVGGALNKNPILIVVPCHRVMGSNGGLVGFGAGIAMKERLLKLERDNLNLISQ
ncbi:methylated-DNA--[protein]-cysteine S-methyltransferase [Tepidimicrobium xylanilyticum]|uniref:Methylated-DNA--protein-cysteine methyltransferase n=1 Tax=Tepidimicrobium xylanilyticum TaxID=1123352 RepID=A0A1H2ZYA9_9FIRM|nr:methylated-DNA--[protein]-cysteine S-methyltransferase [Tepidimicrobium xylanilyticum]SDX22375.1 methylated-DNA-[protein]-cysteine S-methyltransferase [Tepidimicrobium xylanilyticum]